jgi:cytidine deaminase
MDTSTTDNDVNALLKAAIKAKDNSYSPYSKFRVGCALKAKQLSTGHLRTFSGCNVENCAYGGTICAERTAIVKAVSEGYVPYEMMAISSDMSEGLISPCGVCRQFIAEFCEDDFRILSVGEDIKKYETHSMKELLPHAFKPTVLLGSEQK